jgi:transposase
LEHIKLYPEDKLVYVDESGIDAYVYKDFGWAPRGDLIYGEISGKRYARESYVAAKCGKKILAPFCYKGTCDTILFDMWVEDFLVPVLIPGQVVILDNATFHKSLKTRKLIEDAGCSILFLPPYSPDFNPIEKFWAWFKLKIKNVIADFKTLSEAIDNVFCMYTFQTNRL